LPFSAGARTKKNTGWSETDRDRAFKDGDRPAPRLVHAEYCGADQQARGRLLLGRGDLVPSHGAEIGALTKLNDGDLIEVGRVRLIFMYRE